MHIPTFTHIWTTSPIPLPTYSHYLSLIASHVFSLPLPLLFPSIPNKFPPPLPTYSHYLSPTSFYAFPLSLPHIFLRIPTTFPHLFPRIPTTSHPILPTYRQLQTSQALPPGDLSVVTVLFSNVCTAYTA